VATLVDVTTLVLCVRLLKLPNPVGAMCGVTVGAIFTFFANRHFAFRDHKPKLAPQALKFSVATFAAMMVHASLVWLLADHYGVPVVLAKLAADVLVFSVGQLLLLRYLVFPKHIPHPTHPPPSFPTEPDSDLRLEPRRAHAANEARTH